LVTDVAGDHAWNPSLLTATDYAQPPCPVFNPLSATGTTMGTVNAENAAWRWVPRHRGKAVVGFLDGHVETLNLATASANGTILAGRP
jgi:prepilin-type processing-associated H-X9-DG protein